VNDAEDTLDGARERTSDDDEPGSPEGPERGEQGDERGEQGDELLRARLLDALEVLREVQADRGLLAVLDEPTRRELMIAAGHVSRPDRHEIKKLLKALRKRERAAAQRADQALLDQTGIRALRRAAVFPTPPAMPAPPPALAGGGTTRHDDTTHARATGSPEEGSRGEVGEPGHGAVGADAAHTQRVRKCYVCKAAFTKVHAFYDQMCEACAELNWQKRNQTADLRGRVAIVTGARVKIGYHAAIKLLRAGCHVIVTTRFPHDAAQRYGREQDFEAFRDRLEIHGLDLRHTPSVEAFAAHVVRTHDRLDFLLNNACQTVRRPPGFYRHLVDLEAHAEVPSHLRPLLASHEALRASSHEAHALAERHAALPVGLVASAQLSQVALTEDDHRDPLHLFPEGRLDQDLQQVDLRGRNSWRLALDEVPTVELLEVQLVNAIAPFVLDARLKQLMLRPDPVKGHTRDKHIVNVSAMEGQFYREHKTDRHPHTNMAKAALNMLTRTSAADYVKDGIHMNSVDTGWITDEDPHEIAAKKQEVHGFHPPLDSVDGAARIVAPIFDGFLTGEHPWGLFLKDYRPIPW
jgi:NAD(P)-dependent dehydrogenase (short-subunit alcohol dehydrogenase family)